MPHYILIIKLFYPNKAQPCHGSWLFPTLIITFISPLHSLVSNIYWHIIVCLLIAKYPPLTLQPAQSQAGYLNSCQAIGKKYLTFKAGSKCLSAAGILQKKCSWFEHSSVMVKKNQLIYFCTYNFLWFTEMI